MKYVDAFFLTEPDVKLHPRKNDTLQAISEYDAGGTTIYHALVTMGQYRQLKNRFGLDVYTYSELVAVIPAAADIGHHFFGRQFIADPATKKMKKLDGTEKDYNGDHPHVPPPKKDKKLDGTEEDYNGDPPPVPPPKKGKNK